MSPPRLHDGLRLVATRSAVGCARLFVALTLDKWGASPIVSEAVRAVDELVTNAVRATGVMDEHVRWNELTRIEYIIVRLLGLDASIRIEVWDSAPNLPSVPEDVGSPLKHGCYPTSRGKVVWVELPVPPRRTDPRTHPPTPAEQFGPNTELLRRVRDGLDRL